MKKHERFTVTLLVTNLKPVVSLKHAETALRNLESEMEFSDLSVKMLERVLTMVQLNSVVVHGRDFQFGAAEYGG